MATRYDGLPIAGIAFIGAYYEYHQFMALLQHDTNVKFLFVPYDNLAAAYHAIAGQTFAGFIQGHAEHKDTPAIKRLVMSRIK